MTMKKDQLVVDEANFDDNEPHHSHDCDDNKARKTMTMRKTMMLMRMMMSVNVMTDYIENSDAS